MDAMCRVAQEDYSIGHQGMKVGIIYWLRFSWHMKGLIVLTLNMPYTA
jgi:hypothetical protein